jgi:hypothetical protein
MYEPIVNFYRNIKSGNMKGALDDFNEIDNLVDLTLRGPMSDFYRVHPEILHVTQQILETYLRRPPDIVRHARTKTMIEHESPSELPPKDLEK